MVLFDIITGIILLLFFLKGLKNGFVIELASLAALILGIIAAVMFSGIAAEWMAGFIRSKYISILAFVAVFVGVVILVHLIARLVNRLMKAVALGWINRLAGALFGALKGAFLLSAFILLLESFGMGAFLFSPETKQQSFLYEPLHKFAPATMNLLNINIEHLIPAAEEEEKIIV